MYVKKTVSMKVVVLLLAVVLLFGCVAGGTLAWLIADSETVTNTFVAGEIGELVLKETDEDKSFTIVPGVDITKDPTVIFNGNTVSAYLFVKVEAAGDDTWTEDNNVYKLGSNGEMQWTVADGWTKLKSGVYYRTVDIDSDTDNVADTEKYHIIEDDTITVSSTITKANISNFTKTLTFTAYAIQQEGHEGETDTEKATAAWAAINPND